jgi:voltage-gated sodium channel
MTYKALSNYCKLLIEKRFFKKFILSLIVLASLLVGLETYESVAVRYGSLFRIMDYVIVFFFSLEIIIKIIAEGKRPFRFFGDAWNIFDFLIVVSCFVPVTSEFVAIFRLVRILRVLRLISALPKLQLLVSALLKSIPSMLYVVIMMSILFYIYAIMGTVLFQKNDPMHFGSLQQSALSLFTAITLEDWTDMMYTQIYGSDTFGYNDPDEVLVTEKTGIIRQPEARPVAGVLYFASFILVGAMVVINMFVGVILSGIDEVKMEMERKERIAQLEKNGTTLYDEISVLAIKMEELKNQMDYIKDRLQHDNKNQPK